MSSPPLYQVKLTYTGPSLTPSYFDANFVGSSLFGSGVYDAWCADRDINIDLAAAGGGSFSSTFNGYAYSIYEPTSFGSAFPSIETPGNLASVNWLLNQNFSAPGAGYTFGEVQAAVWQLLGDDWVGSTSLGTVDAAKVAQLLALASGHSGYRPDITDADPTNDNTLVLLDLYKSDGTVQQPIIIEVKSAALGDRVWHDSDADGIQDTGELGIAGAIVRLVRDGNGDGIIAEDEVLGTTTTDANGNYTFTGLTPGLDYQVQFFTPAGYEAASPRQADGSATSGSNSDGALSDVVVLAPGEWNKSLDAGFFNTGAIGNFVWNDSDNDGLQDAGEAGVGGVTLTLTGTTGGGSTVTLTTTTAPDGSYLFDNLVPGTYQVTVDASNFTPGGALEGFNPSPTGQGSNIEIDSNGSPSGPIALESGENDLSIDFGFNQPVALGSIGDTVWVDANGNGIQDAGEAGLGGVIVKLYDCSGEGEPVFLTQTTTDANGNYTFADLEPGKYTVQFVSPEGYVFSSADVGNDAFDSDAGVNGLTGCYTLAPGEHNTSVDAGLVRTASLGDRVWEDKNANGVQDSGELGVAGVQVRLYDATNPASPVFIAATTTDANGNYSFTDLAPGQYSVQFVTPLGYYLSSSNVGNDALDSDAGTNGFTGAYTLNGGDNNLTVDAGIYRKAVIGDRIWYDDNGNGIQDAGEAGVAGVRIELRSAYNSEGTSDVLAVTTTDANGYYSFTVDPGTYHVDVDESRLPAGYGFTTGNVGGNDAIDSDVVSSIYGPQSWGMMADTTLESGEVDLSWDAGIVAPRASLGDTVWEDKDYDGIQDSGEAGVAGVTVRLLNSSGTVVATTTTDANGKYLFNNLNPGDYRVEVVKPTDYFFTKSNVGSDDAIDSDVDTTTGRSALTSLVAGENDLSWDAGIYRKAVIGDRIWYDNNGNGVQDAGEAGVAGVRIELRSAYNSEGTSDVLAVTTTDANGYYSFTVDPGTYHVDVDESRLPAGYGFTTGNVGGNDAIDSDVVSSIYGPQSWGMMADTTLESGEIDLSWDAGIVAPRASLGDTVWEDKDYDGIQDSGEAGVAGVTVRLLNSSGTVVATTTTDANGKYLFNNLNPGDYRIEVVKPTDYYFTKSNVGSDDAIDSDVDTTTGRSALTSLVAGENDLSWDAGIYRKAVIGDRIWYDNNGNGVQDAGEAGVAGVQVDLMTQRSTNTGLASTTTDANGYYSFTVDPGTYHIDVVESSLPAGYTFTTSNVGSNDAIDSDVVSSSYGPLSWGKMTDTVLESGEVDLTWDAGIVAAKACIGDTVWEDKDYDGIQDSGEAGVAGVTVRLLNSSGTVVATTTTDANGKYLFNNLNPGDYRVEVVKPSGYYFTKSNVGSNDAIDSDVDTSTGRTALTNLSAGETDLSWDAGLYRKASIGDKVWEDINKNNIQDAGEPGIANIKVQLLNSSGSVIATTYTNSSGNYLFSNLDPGTYSLAFDKAGVYHKGFNMNNWEWVRRDYGSNDSRDSDVGSTTRMTLTNKVYSAQTFLESGENDLTWDAGICPIVIDLNGDGVQTIARADFKGSFDILGTGTPVSTGWLSGDDGFLAVDRNGNGQIDDVTELFGGLNKGDGFALLASYDTNGDGVVDAGDAEFGDLRVWRDANSDGRTDDGELVTLADAGIASLDVGFVELPFLDANKNLHLERGTANLLDGTQTSMTDVYFNVAQSDLDAAGVSGTSLADLLGDIFASANASSGEIDFFDSLDTSMPVAAQTAAVDCVGCLDKANLGDPLASLFEPSMMV